MVMGVISLWEWELFHCGNGSYITVAMGVISMAMGVISLLQ